jgi:adenine-specific DNA-methyltransferase
MNFIVNETAEKLRGGYYTPAILAEFIIKYAIKNKNGLILEPSCGDGTFLKAINYVYPQNNLNITGIEIDKNEAKRAKQQLHSFKMDGKIMSDDFLNWYINNNSLKDSFDAVIGNPPFIRYQYLPSFMQDNAEKIFDQLNLKFTKHTNAWITFVITSIDLLKPEGRIGMVIPSEIFNVIHAQSLREYLGETCSEITIIDPEDIWFESTLQGAVILFAQKKKNPNNITNGLGVIRVKGFDFCKKNPDSLLKKISRINGRTIAGKWTNAFLSKNEYSLYIKLKDDINIKYFSDVAEADVGIVTGANDYFLVNQETVEKYELQEFSYPMFGRSEHCPGILYSKAVHQDNLKKGLPTSFLWFNSEYNNLTKKQREYIKMGESQNLHSRYKCRIRSPWYKVPSVYSTKIGMLKRSHDLPRLIFNEIGALTTDTAYRIKCDYLNNELLVYCFMNSLTALSAELEGRSYGGGVLELVPSEINQLLIPIAEIKKPDIKKLDQIVRSKNPETYLPLLDNIILGGIGISERDQKILFNAWLKLKNRRQRKNI